MKRSVYVCGGGGCLSSGCMKVKDELLKRVRESGIDNEVEVKVTGCMGPCSAGPIMRILPENVYYSNLKPEDVGRIVEKHLIEGKPVEELEYKNKEFLSRQVKIALRNVGRIDPLSIGDYIENDGYQALRKVLKTMTPHDVIEEMKKSGLRGRGGAGFPTGLKWSFAAKALATPKYVVCNADEGDPGAFMDRSILEGDPHSVLEGMAIAGYAIGSNQGYVYVRAEYPLAVERLTKAIRDARNRDYLGKNLFGTGFDFDVDIRVGAGAFVCGEETALIAPVEGKRGEPRPKPPFPADRGLWGKPTIINNVETLAQVPIIIIKGAEWFAGIGDEKSKGTKVFALAGKVNNTGLVEVPMGTPLGDIIFNIGGGIPEGRRFKAAQTGGPSGGCIPVDKLNTPVDYESLTELGTIMGSGGLIVLDEDTCMVDFARFFLEFIKEESCGKCAPCRIGTTRMLEILDRITKGQGQDGDIERLEKLGNIIKKTALCGLGQTAPNPVLSTIRYFRDEYEEHIKDKRCRASVCASMFIAPCQNACPAGVDVPRYIDAIRNRDYVKAVSIIKENNPLPSICGRVCDHPCEFKCRRAQIDAPMSIKALKRFAGDYELKERDIKEEKKSSNGYRVAIIGSGPAGLSCAYYLAKEGYDVTIFEALPVAGGMLIAGIPEYRLPRDILNQEIKAITDLGVKIRTNTRLGEDMSVADLERMGFDAVFIGIGAHKDVKMNIPGEELVGVYSGVQFLREFNVFGKRIEGNSACVIGGGNVAVDTARSLRRMGFEKVYVLYRRGESDMPANKDEIDEARLEGVEFMFYVNPVRFKGRSRVEEVECVKMRAGEFDERGRRKTYPVEGSNFFIKADAVVEATGQVPDLEALRREFNCPDKGDALYVDKELMTNIPGIFAGGDVVLGPSTVIKAIAQGKKAAYSIDRYLGGTAYMDTKEVKDRVLSAPIIETPMERLVQKEIPLNERLYGFKEVQLDIEEEAAVKEASRCLRCDVK
ncbi:MAG: NADH-quinone oxidoreductase subunit NuoF [Clostridiales bacterium]|nr:NADH-quinone oxidoreductase subunit NuoF [Clostridiales bacterium]